MSEDCENVYHIVDGKPVKAKAGYTSNSNERWLSGRDLRLILGLEDIYVKTDYTGYSEFSQGV